MRKNVSYPPEINIDLFFLLDEITNLFCNYNDVHFPVSQHNIAKGLNISIVDFVPFFTAQYGLCMLYQNFFLQRQPFMAASA